MLVYNGFGYERARLEDDLSQAEWDYLLNHGWTENAFHFSSFRLPKAAIERVLQLYFHISLDEANTAAMEERYPYWAETDCILPELAAIPLYLGFSWWMGFAWTTARSSCPM